MPSPLAITVFARLCAYFPQLGGDDAAADERARGWCAVIDRSDPRVAERTCVELVEGWAGSFPPKIADWQDLARRIATQLLAPELPALDGPIADPRGIAAVNEVRAKLTMQRARATPPLKADPKPERGPVDPHGHMPSYAEVYEAEKEPAE